MSAKPDLKIARVHLSQRPDLRSHIINTLKGTRYFSMVSSEILEYVLRESQLVRLRPGDTLIAEGSEDIDAFYFLLNGSVGVHAAGKYIHSINDVGDAVGEMGVITQSPRSADVIAELEAELVEIPWQVIKALQARDPQSAIAFFEVMTVFLAEKLKTTTQRVHLYEGFVVGVMEEQRTKDVLTDELRAKFQELAKSNKNLKNLAIRDRMTNLFNHAEFEENLARQITIYRRNQEPFSLVIGDLDDFKQVNDTYGHLVGDRVIRNTADTLVRLLRAEIDSIYRYGGEEFAILMRNTPESIGTIVMNRIRGMLEVSAVQANGTDLYTTMSIGVGGFHPEWQMEEFIAKVDQALYCAKRSGKNKVVPVAEAMGTAASADDA
ncbi:MAG: GGDEF domain-containing protein [SAR324 cluster bacterium]|nr:GGDEF domain-containing protein [SAR324 cluster bacterium]